MLNTTIQKDIDSDSDKLISNNKQLLTLQEEFHLEDTRLGAELNAIKDLLIPLTEQTISESGPEEIDYDLKIIEYSKQIEGIKNQRTKLKEEFDLKSSNLRKESIDLTKDLFKKLKSHTKNMSYQIGFITHSSANPHLLEVENGIHLKTPKIIYGNSCGYRAAMGMVLTTYSNDIFSQDLQKVAKAEEILNNLKVRLLEAKEDFEKNIKTKEILQSWSQMFDSSIDYLDRVLKKQISPLEIFTRFFKLVDEIGGRGPIGELNGFVFLGRYLTENYGNQMIHYDDKHNWHLHKIYSDLGILPKGVVTFNLDINNKVDSYDIINYDELIMHTKAINMIERNFHITPQISFELFGQMFKIHVENFLGKEQAKDLGQKNTVKIEKQEEVLENSDELIVFLKYCLSETIFFILKITFDLINKFNVINHISSLFSKQKEDISVENPYTSF